MNLKRNLFLILLFASCGVMLLSGYWGIPLELSLLGVTAAVLGLYLAIRFPEWFLVAAIFAPQWKTFWFFKSLGKFGDLTLVILLALVVSLAWRVILWCGNLGYSEIRSLFSRQFGQIMAFAVFAAIVTCSYTYTDAPDYGGTKLTRFLFIGTLLFVSPFFLIFTEEDFRHFARLFIGFAAITSLQIVASLEMRSQDAEGDITRIGAGWLMGMAILLLLFYPIVRVRTYQRTLTLFLVPIFLAGLMASAARGPMVALAIVVCLGVAVWLKEGRMRISTAIGLLVLLTAGIGGAFLVLRSTDSDKYMAKATELETMIGGGSTTGSAGKRVNFYRATLAALPNQPLLGTGVGSWAVFYYGSDLRNYPHDLPLEIAFEEGIVGLLSFLVILGLSGVSIVQMVRASRSHFLAPALLVPYCVIVSLFSGDLDDNRVLWLWLGVALSVCRMVQVRLSAIRAMRYTAQYPPPPEYDAATAPAFSRRMASEKYSLNRKDREWRAKYVF